MNRTINLPLQSGNTGGAPPLRPRPRQTQFGRGGNIGASALALANAGSFGVNTNAAELATAPSVPTGSSYASVGQAGSAGNVTPQGQQVGYTGDNFSQGGMPGTVAPAPSIFSGRNLLIAGAIIAAVLVLR
jgi:hypothetical protein